MKKFSFEIKKKMNGLGRTGVISTPNGDIQTPAFVAVGTILYAVVWIGLGAIVFDWLEPARDTVFNAAIAGDISYTLSNVLSTLLNITFIATLALISAIPVGVLHQFMPNVPVLPVALSVAVIVGGVIGITGVEVFYAPSPDWGPVATVLTVVVLAVVMILAHSKVGDLIRRRLEFCSRGKAKPPLS